MIKIKNLSMSFDKKIKSLDNVSLEFKDKQITGLIGFNGSGKTTTFNIIADFLTKYTGRVEIDGIVFNEAIESKKLEIKQTMSYLGASIPSRDNSKVMVYLKQIGFIYGLNRKEIEKNVNKIAAKINFVHFLNNPIKSLSKGNQQKIKVISALLNPKLKYLILDEPFDGLDPVMVESIKNIFLELKNITIIITSHRMEVVQSMCKEFYVLKDGILIDAKTTNDKKVTLSVNKGVSIASIKKLKCVIEIKESGDKIIILIDSMENFKVVNKKLIADDKYIYSSFEEKNISAAVFEGYGK
ncbi:MAG: ABC transporter ATP-binding protein [Mycoplasmataceae bacterium]|nr:ABC transporter ATP-binding protein [Mycoplasmataceae bacterium]